MGQALHHLQVRGVLAHRGHLLEVQRWRPAASLRRASASQCSFSRAEPAVKSAANGESTTICTSPQASPGRGLSQCIAVDDLFQLVQQLLRSVDAEGGHQHRAAVAEGMLTQRLQALAAGFAAVVHSVAVGALQHQHLGAHRRLGRWDQRRVRRSQVAGEHHTLAGLAGLGGI